MAITRDTLTKVLLNNTYLSPVYNAVTSPTLYKAEAAETRQSAHLKMWLLFLVCRSNFKLSLVCNKVCRLTLV